MATKKMTMGLIVGNRGFFPDHLAKSGREEMLRVLEPAGMDVGGSNAPKKASTARSKPATSPNAAPTCLSAIATASTA